MVISSSVVVGLRYGMCYVVSRPVVVVRNSAVIASLMCCSRVDSCFVMLGVRCSSSLLVMFEVAASVCAGCCGWCGVFLFGRARLLMLRVSTGAFGVFVALGFQISKLGFPVWFAPVIGGGCFACGWWRLWVSCGCLWFICVVRGFIIG